MQEWSHVLIQHLASPCAVKASQPLPAYIGFQTESRQCFKLCYQTHNLTNHFCFHVYGNSCSYLAVPRRTPRQMFYTVHQMLQDTMIPMHTCNYYGQLQHTPTYSYETVNCVHYPIMLVQSTEWRRYSPRHAQQAERSLATSACTC